MIQSSGWFDAANPTNLSLPLLPPGSEQKREQEERTAGAKGVGAKLGHGNSKQAAVKRGKNSISSLSFLSTQAVPLLPVPFSSVTPTNLCSGSACLRISLTTASYFKLYKGSLSREQCRSFGESPNRGTQTRRKKNHTRYTHTHTQSTRTHTHTKYTHTCTLACLL